MKKTSNYYYKLPDKDDRVLIGDLNQNSENIDLDIKDLQNQINDKAPKLSPTFSGLVTIPEPGTEDADTGRDGAYGQAATTNFVIKTLEVEDLDA